MPERNEGAADRGDIAKSPKLLKNSDPPSASHRRWANPLLNMGGVSGGAKKGPLMTTLIIDGLNRDVLKRRSIVTLKWENDPEKRLGLPVPFDCPLDTLRAEAEKAVRALAKELESATIQGP